jgi:hypothetical protein
MEFSKEFNYFFTYHLRHHEKMDPFGSSPANPHSVMNLFSGQTPNHPGGSILGFGGSANQPMSNYQNLFGSVGPSSALNAGAQSIHSMGGPG